MVNKEYRLPRIQSIFILFYSYSYDSWSPGKRIDLDKEAVSRVSNHIILAAVFPINYLPFHPILLSFPNGNCQEVIDEREIRYESPFGIIP